MITPDQIAQFKRDALEAKKIRGFSTELRDILNADGSPGTVSSGNISEYLSGEFPPSERVYKAFYSLYRGSNGHIEPKKEDAGQTLAEISAAHRELIAAHKDLTESNKSLAKTQESIVQELKAIGRSDPKKFADETARMSVFLELLSEVVKGTPITGAEAIAKLGMLVPSPESKVRKRGTQKG